ncbi:acyltransferase [Methanothermobacter sp. THM-2]|nr:acyltransferase [Methanothermobacter sp. THM-2]QHN08947.1 acyltransferase [Methanothermobacter sp. THM-2]
MYLDRFDDWEAPEIEHGKLTRWNWMVQHPENLKLGVKTDIGAFTYINARYGVTLGDHVQIGSHCSIYSESTIDNKKGPVKIGRNARIGSHSLIMPGVEIGENSVIGAFSFVNRNIPADTLAYGVPVRIIKRI